MSGDARKREFGDYQTPLPFADEVCGYIKRFMGADPDAVIEPTCGIGNFLLSAARHFPLSRLYGIDIDSGYLAEAARLLSGRLPVLINHDLFDFDFNTVLGPDPSKNRFLVIGNPPWVNNSTLSTLGGGNLPVKSNFKRMRGIDALTGSSNFDISEYMIMTIVEAFEATDTVIAMLCKTTVARNVFKEMMRSHIGFSDMRMLNIDAKRVFGVSASGCLLVIRLGAGRVCQEQCGVYDFSEPEKEISRVAYADGRLRSEMGGVDARFDGACCFEWRQGIKHDCSPVMELTKKDGVYLNGRLETVDIEDVCVFPLVKSSGLKKHIISETSKYVIVPQIRVKEDTSALMAAAPRTWGYLCENRRSFDNRRSSVYRGSPPFSVFGVGDYSFSRYKVGVSGFYKKPLFALLHGERPMMVDDTCYFLSFPTYGDAYVAMLMLNSDEVQSFLKGISFPDSKRPYTKKVLERIDFGKMSGVLTYGRLCETEERLSLPPSITPDMYRGFIERVPKNAGGPPASGGQGAGCPTGARLVEEG
ncbi:MAG: hypothetical protein FWH47_02750 [Methanomassiliicoccaceae archaeon]|nr:hypothetical protein [Methanomassiliicoccaceae archaeon]